MNIALFGGTFDPIHAGHLRAARAAARKFRLGEVLFVPSGNPPHKLNNYLTPFNHRFAMVSLACAGEPRFVPSLLEAPAPAGQFHYSINTARKVRRTLAQRDRLFFLIGVDAFLDLPQWKEYRRLLALVDFIVVSRPGFANSAIFESIPPDMVRIGSVDSAHRTIHLRKRSVHILHGVDVPIASRDIREAIRSQRRMSGFVPPLVKEYILKEGLYRPGGPGKTR